MPEMATYGKSEFWPCKRKQIASFQSPIFLIDSISSRMKRLKQHPVILSNDFERGRAVGFRARLGLKKKRVLDPAAVLCQNECKGG